MQHVLPPGRPAPRGRGPSPPCASGAGTRLTHPGKGIGSFGGKRGKWPQAAEEDTLQKASLQKPWRLSDGSSGGTALLVGEPTRMRAPWGPVRGRGGFSPHAQSLQRGDPSGGSSPKAQTQTTAPREAPSAGCCGRAPCLLANAAGAPAFSLMSWGGPAFSLMLWGALGLADAPGPGRAAHGFHRGRLRPVPAPRTPQTATYKLKIHRVCEKPEFI